MSYSFFSVCFCSRTFPFGDHCETCQSQCLTCANSTHCLTCMDSLVLLNNQCVEECPEGYYLNNQECVQCHPICSTCKGKYSSDLKCKHIN